MTMGRPRTSSDAEILAGTARAIARVGPGRLTLAEVGREVGLSPATLVHRFGSKRGLMLALVRHSTLNAAQGFPDEVALAERPLHGLVDSMVRMTDGLTVEALTNHLAFLQLDLSDPEFRDLASEHARATRREIKRCLDAAVATHHLPTQNTERLARSVHVAYNGALLTWALEYDGPVEDWVRREIEATLAAGGAPGQDGRAP